MTRIVTFDISCLLAVAPSFTCSYFYIKGTNQVGGSLIAKRQPSPININYDNIKKKKCFVFHIINIIYLHNIGSAGDTISLIIIHGFHNAIYATTHCSLLIYFLLKIKIIIGCYIILTSNTHTTAIAVTKWQQIIEHNGTCV